LKKFVFQPSNIFFAYDNKIKIGDFGLVTAMTEGCDRAHTPATENENVSFKNTIHTACVGTHLYMSPEQMNGQIYNYKVDIFSLGIIFFELLTSFFTDMERVEALSNLKKSIFPKDFAENYPAEVKKLKQYINYLIYYIRYTYNALINIIDVWKYIIKYFFYSTICSK
jgi:eukaryotic translation initiation factor 2-alpha kinase 3